MALLKTLLVLTLVAAALASHGYEDREEHRARKLAAQNRVQEFDGSDVNEIPMLYRCRTNGETPCPPGTFCLQDDWRCIITRECKHKGGWCFPDITVKPYKENKDRDESSSSESIERD